MTILCEVDDATAAGLAAGLGGALRVVSTLPEAAVALAEDHDETLVVVGQDVPFNQVIDFTARARRERPALGTVLVRRHDDADGVRAALDAGVSEVVSFGDPAMVLDACRRVIAVPVFAPSLADDLMAPPPAAEREIPVLVEAQPARPSGKIVTVFSPKGGSGKTTISTNLAAALSEIAPPVCLIDLDLEFGDVAIALRLTPARTLADAVKMEVDGDEDDALAALTTQYSAGLKCILAPIEPGDAEKIPAELVTDLLALLRSRYALVVVDTPSQLSPHVLAALDQSDHHVLITNPEVPALKNLRLTLDMLDLLHYDPHRRSVVFNRADDAAGISAAEVEQAVHAPIAVRVPASRDVPASINRGTPIVLGKKDHPVSVAITNFAADVLVGSRVGQARRSSRRLFRRKQA